MNSAAGLLMMSFEGLAPSDDFIKRVESNPPAGFTLFRVDNIESIDQTAELVASLHTANSSDLPFLVAVDQEGGQFLALGSGSTPFPGNMALGAVDDESLTLEVGRALGRELGALGIGINYAPIADLNTNPANPSLGIRSFGDRPERVGAHVAAMVSGLQQEGVAATLKHFPGKGDAQVDSHFGLPIIERTRADLDNRELIPFRAGLEAGAALVMTGHFAIPGLTESDDLPSTLSTAVLTGLLRTELGFDGSIITDALDMGAISQGVGQTIDAIAAIRAGVDLLLLKDTLDAQGRLEAALDLASRRGVISRSRIDDALARNHHLRTLFGKPEVIDPTLVGSREHRLLADRVAARSITLVRNSEQLLPLRPATDQRIAAIMPAPKDLTPADTSSYEQPHLADSLRRHHPQVDEFIVSHPPTDLEIAEICGRAGEYEAIVVGTISASVDDAQTRLVDGLIGTGIPLITVALRTPYDLNAYPTSSTHLCTYSILQPSMIALADVIFGKRPTEGRLPVSLSPELPAGSGHQTTIESV
jgi:beta-N-acetylhexosaminidase